MVNFNSLQAFFTSAEHLNISKAAKVMGISQPSLSLQIKTLEQQIGYELFHRNGRGLSLTARGQELYTMGSRFFELQEDILKCLQHGPKSELKKFKIAVTEEVERPFVAELVSSVIKKQTIQAKIVSLPITDLLKEHSQEPFDFFISHEKLDLSSPVLEFQFPVFLVTSKKASAPSLSNLGDVNRLLSYFGEPIIIPAPELKLGAEYELFKKQNEINVPIILESNITSCLVRSVADGLGCSFLPLPFVKSTLFEKYIHSYRPPRGFWLHSIFVYGQMDLDKFLKHPIVRKLQSLSVQ